MYRFRYVLDWKANCICFVKPTHVVRKSKRTYTKNTTAEYWITCNQVYSKNVTKKTNKLQHDGWIFLKFIYANFMHTLHTLSALHEVQAPAIQLSYLKYSNTSCNRN